MEKTTEATAEEMIQEIRDKVFNGGRWLKTEGIISKDPDMAYRYAKDIIEDRWPQGEKAISKSRHVCEYALLCAYSEVMGHWHGARRKQ